MAAYASAASGGGTSGTGSRTATITPAVGNLLVVGYNASANTSTSATVTDDQGGTYTQVNTALWDTSADIGGVYVRNQLVSSAVAHVITVAPGSNTAMAIGVIAISGMTRTGSSAIRQSARVQNETSATTPAPAFSASALTGNMTLGFAFNGRNAATMTAPTNWTERLDIGQPTPSTGLEAATRDSGFTGTTITWGSTYGGTLGGSAVILELDATSILDVSGTLAAGSATISGVLTVVHTLTGVLQAGAATIAGTLAIPASEITLTGDLQASSATMAGILTVGDPLAPLDEFYILGGIYNLRIAHPDPGLIVQLQTEVLNTGTWIDVSIPVIGDYDTHLELPPGNYRFVSNVVGSVTKSLVPIFRRGPK